MLPTRMCGRGPTAHRTGTSGPPRRLTRRVRVMGGSTTACAMSDHYGAGFTGEGLDELALSPGREVGPVTAGKDTWPGWILTARRLGIAGSRR